MSSLPHAAHPYLDAPTEWHGDLVDILEFTESIKTIRDYEEVGVINTAIASQIRADVGVLLRTLEAFIHATFPQAEKKKIGFL